MSNLPDQLQPRALCTLTDVCRRIPGYEAGADGEIDDTLNELIVDESRDFVEKTGREIVAMSSDPRVFDLTSTNINRRSVRIGDCAAVASVELFDFDGTTSLGVIDPGFYVLKPRVRDDWEPIRRITFPYRPSAALLLAPGRTLTVTATWGFAAIPATVRRAVATFVLVRYINDVAAAGTQLADILNQPEFNMAGALRAAIEIRGRLSNPGFA